MTLYSRHVLPSGMVVTLMMPPFDYAYSTPLLSPTSTIPFDDPQESRDEAAAKVLAVLQEQKPQARKRRLPRPHCEPVADYGRIPYSITFSEERP